MCLCEDQNLTSSDHGKSQAWGHICNPSAGEVDTGGLLRLLGSQPNQIKHTCTHVYTYTPPLKQAHTFAQMNNKRGPKMTEKHCLAGTRL